MRLRHTWKPAAERRQSIARGVSPGNAGGYRSAKPGRAAVTVTPAGFALPSHSFPGADASGY